MWGEHFRAALQPASQPASKPASPAPNRARARSMSKALLKTMWLEYRFLQWIRGLGGKRCESDIKFQSPPENDVARVLFFTMDWEAGLQTVRE